MNRINNPAEAAGYFGRGSVLHELMRSARKANKETDMWAIALDDLAAGTAATKIFTITGPATAAGTMALRINSELVPVGISVNDTATNIAANVVAAVTAYLDGPVTADNVAGVVTFTCKHKGEFGNDVDIRVNHLRDEVLPAGVTVVVTVGVAGTGNPDVAAALAAIATESYYSIVMPYTDTANLDKLKLELSSRFGGMDMRTGHLFAGKAGTQAGLTTFGAGRNNVHETMMGVKNPPQGAYNWAASMAAVVEFNGAIDPARSFRSLEVPGLLAPHEADRFSRPERELLLRDGISTFTVDDDGTVRIEQIITTYQTNAQGIDDVSYLKLNTKWSVDFMRYSYRVDVALAYPRHKLADDGTDFDENQPVVTTLMLKGTIIGTARKLVKAGIQENLPEFIRKLRVLRSDVDRNRVNVVIPPNCVNQFDTFAAALQFIL